MMLDSDKIFKEAILGFLGFSGVHVNGLQRLKSQIVLISPTHPPCLKRLHWTTLFTSGT